MHSMPSKLVSAIYSCVISVGVCLLIGCDGKADVAPEDDEGGARVYLQDEAATIYFDLSDYMQAPLVRAQVITAIMLDDGTMMVPLVMRNHPRRSGFMGHIQVVERPQAPLQGIGSVLRVADADDVHAYLFAVRHVNGNSEPWRWFKVERDKVRHVVTVPSADTLDLLDEQPWAEQFWNAYDVANQKYDELMATYGN